MHVIISPAKKQDFTLLMEKANGTEVLYPDMAYGLITYLKQLTPEMISKIMKISPALGELNYQRFQKYQRDIERAPEKKPAVFAYVGDTYQGLDVKSFSQKDIVYAQEHLSIISGLYGVLRPLDLIQPYRLEMAVKIFKDKSLYVYWGEILTDYFNKLPDDIIINLASVEYSSVLDYSKLQKKLMDIVFYQEKKGQLKSIGILSKKARGQMAAFIIKNRIKNPKDLIQFSDNGYVFQPDHSSENKLVFIQK